MLSVGCRMKEVGHTGLSTGCVSCDPSILESGQEEGGGDVDAEANF